MANLAAGAHIHALERLIEHQHTAVAQQPAAQHDFLLVTARQRLHGQFDTGGLHPQRGHGVLYRLRLQPGVDKTVAGETLQKGQGQGFAQRKAGNQRVTGAVFGGVKHPGFNCVFRRIEQPGNTLHVQRSGSRATQTEQHLGNFTFARTQQPGERHHLTFVQV